MVKESGCNKLVCAKCSTMMCYACKMDVTYLGKEVYKHFRSTGSKCPLYDTPRADRHKIEANKAEREAIKKAKQLDASLDESLLRIDTGGTEKGKKPESLLKDPQHPAADIFYRGMMHRHARLDHNQQYLRELAARVDIIRGLLPDPALAAALVNLPPNPDLQGPPRYRVPGYPAFPRNR